MKISELVKRADVRKETIHYYIRAGLLPKPRKLGSNSAEYDESYVERIRLIKDLQNDFFFPLPTIKKIMWEHRGATKQAVLKLRSEYFRPMEQYLGSGVVGDEAFLEATGLSPKLLPRFQEWGFLNPKVVDGRNVYTQDDIIIAKVLINMGELGFSRQNGFTAEALKDIVDKFHVIVHELISYMVDVTRDWKAADREELSVMGHEIFGVFFYHLYRKLANEELENLLQGEPDAAPKD